MLNLIDLPTEILINIFQKSSSNKYQLITLSKTTLPITQPIAYHHITLTSHQSIRSLTTTLRANPELAPLIHSITLVSNPSNQTNHHHHHSPKQNHDESMTFFAFTALLRFTHHITHLELDLEGSNVFELTQLFQAISQSKSSSSIRSLTYLTRSYSSLSTEPDLTQLVSNLSSLTSLSIIGNTRYSNSFHHHPLTNINHHTTLTPSRSNHRHPPNQRSLASNHSLKLLPPIKSLTISSSRLTSSSPSNIQKLIRLCSGTLTELTICGANEMRRATSTQWTETIQDKLQKLTLVGSFFHGDQHDSSLEILAPDWSSLISKFINLKSLKLINNFNWLDSIPILIPITSPIAATINPPASSNPNPQVDLSMIPQPIASSSSSNDTSAPSNTLNNSPENQSSSSNTHPNVPSTSSTSMINIISKPTYYLDYSSLEMLPKSIKELRIETEIQMMKGKNRLDDYHHQDDNNQDNIAVEVTSLDIDNDLNNDHPHHHLHDPILNLPFSHYAIDFDLNWKPSFLWSCLENLDLIVFNHTPFFRPPTTTTTTTTTLNPLPDLVF